MEEWRSKLIKSTLMTGALLLSALVGAWVLVACDGGGSTAPTTGLERSAQLYTQHCQACHPGGNRGAGPALRPVISGLSDQQLTDVIRKGRNRMPGFGEKEIKDDELKLLIAYMREW